MSVGCVGQREPRPGMHDRLWQRAQPAQQRPHLTPQKGGFGNLLDQAGRLLHLARGQGVLDRFSEQPLLHVLRRGRAVQEWQPLRLELLGTAAQQLGKQLVIAIPAPRPITLNF
jgi:hypothetical protein